MNMNSSCPGAAAAGSPRGRDSKYSTRRSWLLASSLAAASAAMSVAPGAQAGAGWAWTQGTGGGYSADSGYSFNSAGGGVMVDRYATGYYGVTTSLRGVMRSPLIGLRSIGQDETAATTSRRHRRTSRSPGFDGAGWNSNSPSARGGVRMNTLMGSGSCHSVTP